MSYGPDTWTRYSMPFPWYFEMPKGCGVRRLNLVDGSTRYRLYADDKYVGSFYE